MKAILFDLDGTLLPMDMDAFTKGYFGLLAKKAHPYGYTDSQKLVDGIWAGTSAMVKNDGSMLNVDRFWKTFAGIYGNQVYEDIPIFDEFYSTDFRQAIAFTQPQPEKAQKAVELAHKAAPVVILATNPLFPAVGVETRLSWLGLKASDFDLVTNYENSRFCKPNPEYYREILAKFALDPKDCLMVGNDVDEDILPTASMGMKNYLITDCLLNKSGSEVECPKGSFDEFIRYMENMI
ncbi:MAG: HAD family hydrolase [Ruminococcaceae bacterium]|nr:HAD family hydrolase [Oscillospiraceae bacterium]